MMIGYVKFLAGVLTAAGLLAGCGGGKDTLPVFDGVQFRSSSSSVDKKISRALFEVEVKEAQASLEGAREAVRFEGTRYCIENYGTSKVDWQTDLDNAQVPLTLVKGTAVVRGTCTP